MVIWGYESRTRDLGKYIDAYCAVCGERREFRRAVRYRYNHLYYLFGFASAVGYIQACGVCGHGTALDARTVEAERGRSGVPAWDRFGLLALPAGVLALVLFALLLRWLGPEIRSIPELAARVASGDVTALEHLRREARAGDLPSREALADLLAGHGNTHFLDDGEALHWALAAAEQGSVGAQLAAGKRYEQGIGTAPDAARALHWYLRAAEGGSADAANSLGALYLQGSGTPADPGQARHWFRVAAASGDVSAAWNLAMTLLTQAEPDAEEGLRWLHAAAASQRTDPVSMAAAAKAHHELGRRYEQGDGVGRDLLRALDSYRAASALEPDAQASVDRLTAALERSSATN